MSLQCQCIIGLHRDEYATKNRCRYNVACSLGHVNEKKVVSIAEKFKREIFSGIMFADGIGESAASMMHEHCVAFSFISLMRDFYIVLFCLPSRSFASGRNMHP